MWNQRLTQLSPVDRAKRVLEFREAGLSQAAIAKRFGVSSATISRMLDQDRKPRKGNG